MECLIPFLNMLFIDNVEISIHAMIDRHCNNKLIISNFVPISPYLVMKINYHNYL